jgi:CRISPR/Cas system CSM-associated protein Csm2 small subunit
MRTIKLKLLTQTALEVVETSARTFGEFKSEISNLGIDWTSAKLIDRATKASFEIDEAVLPSTDAVMFVMPTKSKAGANLGYKEVKQLIKEYKDNGGIVPFNYTQATTEQLNKFWDSIKSIEEVIEETKDSEENIIYLAPGNTYTLVVEEWRDIDGYEEVELLDETTLEDLDDEAVELKQKFN